MVRILRDTADGVSRRELACALTAGGGRIPSPGSYERDPETGRTVVREVKPWALGMITRIVHHPVYEGWLTVREHGRDVPYWPSQTGDRVWAFAEGAEVILAELAARAQRVGQEAADPRMKRKPGKVAHMLTGITTCAGCAARMPMCAARSSQPSRVPLPRRSAASYWNRP